MEVIKSCISALTTAVRSLVKRAYVSNVGSDADNYHTVQISYLSPKKTATAEVINPYGLYTNLPSGIQVLAFSVQANEENKACIGYSQSNRFKNLKPGEVLVGNPATQCFIKFDIDGNIEIISDKDLTVLAEDVKVNASSVVVNSPKVDLGVGGNKIARQGDAVQVDTGTGTGTITGGGTNTSI